MFGRGNRISFRSTLPVVCFGAVVVVLGLFFYQLGTTSIGRVAHSEHRVFPEEKDSQLISSGTRISPCLPPTICAGSSLHVSISQLIKDGNSYDRRLVEVDGSIVMLKDRRSRCGGYLYFVLKDSDGYFVDVTDYTRHPVFLQEKRVRVRGYYRAHRHEIEVCAEVYR